MRQAWLTLGGGAPMPLEGIGYFCTHLDLGYPAVREVINNRPDQHGADDRTSLYGSRLISANITALRSAGASIDDVAASFAPYMDPAARPELHYILDRPAPDNVERVITELRGAGYAWPIEGNEQRDVQLQWVAADPIAYEPKVYETNALVGTGGAISRLYDLTFDRTYTQPGSSPSTGQLVNNGDVIAYPQLRVWGPGQNFQLSLFNLNGDNTTTNFNFLPSFQLLANQYVDIDSANRLVYKDGDLSQSAFQYVDWTVSTWIALLPNGQEVDLTMTCQNADDVTQVQAFWQNGYLT